MTHTVTESASTTEKVRRIPPPSGVREPLKVNVFDFLAGCVCTLKPLFPYLGAGAMVPTGALLMGDPDDSDWGQFFHFNTVDEVFVAFGANGSFLQSGQILVGQELHGVNSTLRDPADRESYSLTTITQHQPEDRESQEAIMFRCTECSEQLLRYDFDATAEGIDGYDPSRWGGSPEDGVEMFTTTWGSTEAVIDYNDESVRTCSKCGHLNPEFPIHKWGWKRHVDQVQAAIWAKRSMDAAAGTARAAGKA